MTLRTHYPYRNVDEALRELVREEEREQEALRRFRERERKYQRRAYAIFFLRCALYAAAVWLIVVGLLAL